MSCEYHWFDQCSEIAKLKFLPLGVTDIISLADGLTCLDLSELSSLFCYK